jgi:TolB-like protein
MMTTRTLQPAADAPSDDAAVRFGRFEWHPAQRQLSAEGRKIVLGARACELLGVLIGNRDRVMAKGDLLEQAWPGLVVEENNLTVQISALRKVLGDEAIVTVSGRGYRWAAAVLPSGDEPPQRRAKPSLAVLPFVHNSGSDDQEYFGDGLAEDIVAGLSRSPWLFVVASSASFCWRGARQPASEVCQALGVQYLLQGTVRTVGGRLRLSAELIDGRSSGVVWAERYDRPMDGLFDLQDDIAARIVGTIEPAFLKQEEQRAAKAAVRDLQHWDLVMRARWHYWRSSRRHSAEARRLLEMALRLRPDDVATLALLAFSLSTENWSGWAADPRATAVEARRLATRAVALDDMDAFAHFTLGVTLLGFGELDAAIAEQRRALALYPHFAACAAELGRLLAFAGDTVEGERLTRQAIADSPTEPRMGLWVFSLGMASFIDGRHAAAAEHARAAISLRRDWFFNHLLLAASLACLGQLAAAREALAEGVRLVPGLTLAALRIGHPFKRDADLQRYVDALRTAGWQA